MTRTRNGHYDHNKSIRKGKNPLWKPPYTLNWTMVTQRTYKGSVIRSGNKFTAVRSVCGDAIELSDAMTCKINGIFVW